MTEAPMLRPDIEYMLSEGGESTSDYYRILRHRSALCKYALELEVALIDLYENIGGHWHWDDKGTCGRSCPTCIKQGAASERVMGLVHQARDERDKLAISDESKRK